MKKLVMGFVLLFVLIFILSGCAQKDFRLIKDYYPATIDTPNEVSVVPSFPSKQKEGAVKNVLSIRLKITNNSRRTINIDPSDIYLMVGTEMHATLPAESVLPSRKDSDFILSGQTLRPNESIRGIVYFPKTSVEKIKEERVFNLNIDLGQGKKAVVVFQK